MCVCVRAEGTERESAGACAPAVVIYLRERTSEPVILRFFFFLDDGYGWRVQVDGFLFLFFL